MTLPEAVRLCDTIEIEALRHQVTLSLKDIGSILFRDANLYPENGEDLVYSIKEALRIATRRDLSCRQYPFSVSVNSITAKDTDAFNPYIGMLLGWACCRSGLTLSDKSLPSDFRRYFEDLVRAVLLKQGFLAEVLSVPREFRGLPRSLREALSQISTRFGDVGTLDAQKVTSDDNDLDVDVVASPIRKQGDRVGWPVFLIQCSCGRVELLQSKIDEGRNTFSDVWKNGFWESQSIRSLATPHDLLELSEIHWSRLSKSGLILDRTRLADVENPNSHWDAPPEYFEFFHRLNAAIHEFDSTVLLRGFNPS